MLGLGVITARAAQSVRSRGRSVRTWARSVRPERGRLRDDTVAVVELVQRDGRLVEQPAPRSLPSDRATLLDVYGSLLYAGSRTLQARLPDPSLSRGAVVVLRLRGRTTPGATSFRVIATYAHQLQEIGGRLYLSGLDERLHEQLRQVGGVDVSGPVPAFEARPEARAWMRPATRAAGAWLVRHRGGPAPASHVATSAAGSSGLEDARPRDRPDDEHVDRDDQQ